MCGVPIFSAQLKVNPSFEMNAGSACFRLMISLLPLTLIPLALRGIAYRPVGAGALLRRHLLIYGVGGVIVPFIGIKVIDMMLVALGLV